MKYNHHSPFSSKCVVELPTAKLKNNKGINSEKYKTQVNFGEKTLIVFKKRQECKGTSEFLAQRRLYKVQCKDTTRAYNKRKKKENK